MSGAKILAVDTAPKNHRGHLAWRPDRGAGIRVGRRRACVVRIRGYQKAAKLRQAAADCNAVIVAGF